LWPRARMQRWMCRGVHLFVALNFLIENCYMSNTQYGKQNKPIISLHDFSCTVLIFFSSQMESSSSVSFPAVNDIQQETRSCGLIESNDETIGQSQCVPALSEYTPHAVLVILDTFDGPGREHFDFLPSVGRKGTYTLFMK
jgi:hypothetical protein